MGTTLTTGAGGADVTTEQAPADTPPAESSGSVTPVGREEPGRYRLIRSLAQGGQGVVSVAWDAHLGREVAFKQLRIKEAASDPDALTPYEARFVREARITAQLEHPGIAPLFEVGRRPDGTLYATQRLIRGRTMAEALDACATLEERLALVPRLAEVCDAVGYAHARGVIHRDLKPNNVLLPELGPAVVLDWGLGKTGDPRAPALPAGGIDSLLASDAGRTHAGSIFGTPAYMSPEQAVSANAVDARTDVWSLGVMLYEVLTGSRPFEGGSSDEVLRKIAMTEPKPILEIEKRAPRLLVAIAEKALTRDAALRHADAVPFGAELQGWVRAHPRARARWGLAGVVAATGVAALGLLLAREKAISPAVLPTAAHPSRLSVETEPPGATVLVDGTSRGPTPWKMELAPGEHQVEVIRDGYRTIAQTLSVGVGESSSLWLNLAPTTHDPPLIAVATDPAGAQLFVDGVAAGPTPIKVRSTPGDHQVKLVLDGYETRTGRIMLPATKDFELRMAISLKPVGSTDEKLDRLTSKEVAKAQVITAHACSKTGDYECAINAYQKAFEYEPNPLLVFNIAQMRRKKGDFAGAQRAYQAFLKAPPAGQEKLRLEAEKQLAYCELKLNPSAAADTPWIEHEPLLSAVRQRQLRIEASLRNGATAAPWMQACWSTLQSPDFRCAQMAQGAPGTFTLEVPAEAVSDGFAYYLEGPGGRGKRPVQNGSPDFPWVPDLRNE